MYGRWHAAEMQITLSAPRTFGALQGHLPESLKGPFWMVAPSCTMPFIEVIQRQKPELAEHGLGPAVSGVPDLGLALRSASIRLGLRKCFVSVWISRRHGP